MAPAASKEEEADTVAPAAPEQQEDVDSTLDEMMKKKKIEETMTFLGSHRARCSEIVEAARRGRGTGNIIELRCLDFMEKELSYIVAGLMTLSPQHVDEEMMRWLDDLIGMDDHLIGTKLTYELDEADPQRHNTILRRAMRCFSRRHRHPYWLLDAAAEFYLLAVDPRKDMQLLRATSRHGLPPQAEEGGGILSMDIDWLGRRLLPPFDDSPYGNSPLIILYMSMFPYGCKFEKDRLVMKLLFEGIFSLRARRDFPFLFWYGDLSPGRTSRAEAEAEADGYFTYLLDRNVITHAAPNSRRPANLPDEAEAWEWNLNPIQYQFLATKSAEMGFVFTSATLNLLLAPESATGHGNKATRTPRRLALHLDDPNIPSLLQEIDLSQTRSLAVSGAVSIGVPLDKFVNLVVLDVEGWENFGDEDLLQTCRSKMYFLVYLSVRNTRVSKLPPEIKELCSLQVLDASKTQVTEIPFGVFVGTRLRRLDARGTPIRQLTMPEQILGGLQKSFLHLLGGETATRVAHDFIRHFWRLRTLPTIDLCEQPVSFVKALGDLEWLEVLAITWSFHQSSDRDYCEALLSSIKRWRGLESLTIHCGLGCSMEFLGSLSDAPSSLEKFKVTLGRFAGVPQWFHWLDYLSVVQITICKLVAGDLEILRGLPSLKCLLLGLDFIPKEAIVIGNEGFLRLERFSVDCPVPWLTFESGAMRKLIYLQLEFRGCPTDPISVPSGISNLSSLTEVALYYNVRYTNSSNVKMTVEVVRKEVVQCRSRTTMISLFINDTKQDDVQSVAEETGNTTRAPSAPDARAKAWEDYISGWY